MAKEIEENDQAQKEAREVIEKLGKDIPVEAQSMIAEAYVKMKTDSILPKDALGFSPQMIEMIYQYAFNFFQTGKYKEALNIFNFLRQLDISDVRYSFGIAACYHHEKQYLEAIANYLICKQLDPFDPIYCFHITDCFLKADYPLAALYSIEEAHVLAQKGSNVELQKKIELERKNIQENLKKMVQEKKEILR